MEREETVVITNPYGLHARASVKFAALARQYRSEVTLARGPGGEEVDGKNVLGLLTLGAERGHSVRIRVRGEDATQALDALKALIHSKFNES